MIRMIKKTSSNLLLLSIIFTSPAIADKIIKKPLIKIPVAINNRDINCLAQTIYFEAKNQPKEGQVAVGVTTLNRTRHELYPNSICGVVYHKTRDGSKTLCQYSWVCQKRLKLPKSDDELWLASLQLAKELISGNYAHWQKKYSKSLFFHATYAKNHWQRPKISRVGQHIFYQ